MHDGVIILDRYGKVIKANDAFHRILSLNKTPSYYQELLGEYLQESIFSTVAEQDQRVTIMEKNKKHSNQLMITGTPVRSSQVDDYRIVVTVRDMEEIDALRKELESTKEHLNILMQKKESNDKFIAHSPKMRKLLNEIEQVAKVDSTILLYGESGVGKEAISKIIHNKSNRRNYPFIKVNCGAIPESLMGTEFFGEEHSGPNNESVKKGYFERAHKGTIVLDEIGELPLTMQVKLLKVLQEKEITREGGSSAIPIDVRIVASTNQDLMKQVHKNKFRKDLYYRLHVIPLNIPPLRERIQDIPLLTMLFYEKFSNQYELQKSITDEAVKVLTQYYWPGNVRELINLIERLVVTTKDQEITESHVMKLLNNQQENFEQGIVYVNGILPLKEAVEQVEKQLISRTMKLYKNTRQTANALDVNQSTVVRKIKKLSFENGYKEGETK